VGRAAGVKAEAPAVAPLRKIGQSYRAKKEACLMRSSLVGLPLRVLVLLVVGVLLSAPCATPAQAGEGEPIDVVGILSAHVVAIGGETTGVTLTTEDGVYELDLGGDEKLQALAEELDGQLVEVTGLFRIVPGIEIPLHYIITVETLEPLDP
jgi:hypothetical protein